MANNKINNLPTLSTTGQLYVASSDKNISSFIKDVKFSKKNHVVKGSSSDTSTRSFVPTSDYSSLRGYHSIPTKFKDIVKQCRLAYITTGIVRNAIDLMVDFASEDFSIVHHNKKDEAFFKVWAKKANIAETANEFFKHLFIDCNVVPKRHVAKLTEPAEKQWMEKSDAGEKIYVERNPLNSREIPIRYSFINILALDWVSDLDGGKKLKFKVNPDVLSKIRNSDSTIFQSINKNSPDIAETLKTKDSYDLDMTQISAIHYKKDSWDDWAIPFLYSVLSDLKYKARLKQADDVASQGMINVLRVWKLGDHENKIFPTEAAMDRLVSILENNSGGDSMDIIWDSMISMEEFYPPVGDILGPEKFQEVDKDILIGLGIPEVLIGGGGGNFSNSFIQLKTIVERLKYAREKFSDWLYKEIELVCDSMDIKVMPKVKFGVMNLEDENTTRKLLVGLLDRGIVSAEAVLQAYGEDFLMEIERMSQEKEIFKKNGIKVKGPYDQKPTTNKSGVTGRPPASKDTQTRQRQSIKPRRGFANQSLIIKGMDIIDKIDEYATDEYLKSVNINNLRKLNASQKKEVDNIKLLILSSITKNEQIDENLILTKMENIDKADFKLYNYISNALNEYISENSSEPTTAQKNRIYAIAWANFTGESYV